MADSNTSRTDANQVGGKAKRAVRSVLFGRLGYQLVTIGFTLALARILTPSDYGVYGIAFVAMQFLIYLEGMRIEAALIQRPSLRPAEEAQGYALLIGLGFVFAVLLYALAAPLANIFGAPDARPLIRLLSLTFIIRGLSSAQRVRLRRELRFGALAVMELVGLVPGGLLAVWLAMHGYGPVALAAFYLVQSFGSSLMAFVFAGVVRPAVPTASITGELLKFGIPATGSEIVSYLWFHAPSIFVGYGLGSVALGFFRQARALVSKPVMYLQEVTQQLAFPVLSRAKESGYALKGSYLHAFHAVCLVAIPICMFTLILAPELVWVLYGSQWDSIVPLVRILVPVAFAKVVHPFASGLFQAYGKPSVDLKINAIVLVVLMALLALGLQLGLTGEAAATSLSFGALAIVAQVTANRWLDVSLSEIASTMLTGFGASLLSVGLAFTIRLLLVPDDSYLLSLLVTALIGMATYALCIRQLDRQSWNELIALLNPFKAEEDTP